MPKRAPRPCTYPGCGEYASKGGRCEQHSWRPWIKREDNRASRHERGYDAKWVKLRKIILARDRWCQPCRKSGIIEPATQVDHIVPKSQGGMDDESNLQGICEPCHRTKSRTERIAATRPRRDQARPKWLPPPSIPVYVVCGPPASGKSVYARTHAGPRDCVVDLDDIASSLAGHAGHDWDRGKYLNKALSRRNAILASWEHGGYERGWLILTGESRAERDWWREKLLATVVVMETLPYLCAERAAQSGRLNDRLRYLIARWWETYERDERDVIVLPEGL